jgi:hypothetical protein
LTDAPQAPHVVLVAGAVLSAAVLSVASAEHADVDRAQAVAAADELAIAIARSGCSADVPLVHLDLGAWQVQVKDRVHAAQLHDTHVRLTLASGETVTSIAFRPLGLGAPIDLLAAAGLALAYDPLAGPCTARAIPAENP